MFDKLKIILGIIVFLVIVLGPFWYNSLTGKAHYIPNLKIASDTKQCIENTRYMKSGHTDLLDRWKESVVRKNERLYKADDGKTYLISLTGTCLKCHSNKAQFCDRCHDYAGVKPQCWDCHITPGTTVSNRQPQ